MRYTYTHTYIHTWMREFVNIDFEKKKMHPCILNVFWYQRVWYQNLISICNIYIHINFIYFNVQICWNIEMRIIMKIMNLPSTYRRLSWFWSLDASNRRVEVYFPYKVDNRFVVIYGCNVRICTYAARACYYCSHDAESFRWTTRPPHTISMPRPWWKHLCL